MNSRHRSPEIELLLRLIDESYEKKAWHGPNLRGSIRGLSSDEAAWRTDSKRHNIWEIVVHAAYWKYIVRRRLTGEKRGSFPIKGSNWFRRPQSKSDSAWIDDIHLLDEVHRSMRDVIEEMSSKNLETIPTGSNVSNVQMISGIASHDVYHTGQIQILKRLMT